MLIDYQTWMDQPLIWGERCRGRSLAWTPDASWFINDPLGPIPHLHPKATEIAFLAQGSMEIEVGGSKRIYKAGDYLLMPPEKFHNYWFHGVDPVCLFVLVAPNHKYNRWRTGDFPPDAHEGEPLWANAFESDQLPSNEHIAAEVKTLAPGASEGQQGFGLQDRVIYVLSGTAQLTLGSLNGPLVPNQYQYIPATVRHEVRNGGYTPLRFLSLVITDPDTAKGTELHVEND